MLEHGGRLKQASEQYGIPLENWIDLSTGINPNSCPVPVVPSSVWHRLPESDGKLHIAAAHYYGSQLLLPVAGTQAALKSLPLLRELGQAAMLHPSYNEHCHAWKLAGHEVRLIPSESYQSAQSEIEKHIDRLDVLLVCNPNNPTGITFPISDLERWRENLARRGGWLIVDEAFMDVSPQFSLVSSVGSAGLIVLRSLGKFFGLAGARVGFVFACKEVLDALSEQLGPWTISGPARFVATAALEDITWQRQARADLIARSERLGQLLLSARIQTTGATTFFHWMESPSAFSLHKFLARQGILTRFFSDPSSLRFGLPGAESEWRQLEAASHGWLDYLTAARTTL
ncbi:threonine-phosphate decarboxylase CobD [soil metagenome]